MIKVLFGITILISISSFGKVIHKDVTDRVKAFTCVGQDSKTLYSISLVGKSVAVLYEDGNLGALIKELNHSSGFSSFYFGNYQLVLDGLDYSDFDFGNIIGSNGQERVSCFVHRI